MLGFNNNLNLHIWNEVTDMRKSFDSLSELIRSTCNVKLAGSSSAYIFFNKKLDRIKIIYWDLDGYCLWYKRLEVGKFKYKFKESGVVEIDYESLKNLLSGMEFERIKFRKSLNNNC